MSANHSQSDDARLQRHLEAWQKTNVPMHAAQPVIERIFRCSPFLTGVLFAHPDILQEYQAHGADAVCARLLGALARDVDALPQEAFMQHLRLGKARMALLVALADLAGEWDVARVTQALSLFAELCLTLSVDFLLRRAANRGEITLASPMQPSKESGLIVLGMGKLGGRELNYSSDIDLILLFEKGRLSYQGRSNEQQFMNKLAHDLVQLMQERTKDGYVFRTDLRLRPDPASTPPAVNIDAAHYYYESVGQNWERAAMIKARPVAGDIAAGELFLKNITPFMWRRNLDFAAIQDIHSIKRQMDSHHAKDIRVSGHNIKLGMGGIREIEFYTQIHQLIWGGKQPALRLRGTCETLDKLQQAKLVDAATRETLVAAYRYLRKLEHRLQMVDDAQTHEMPRTPEELTRIAHFMEFDDSSQLEKETLAHLHAVHAIFANSFQSSEKLGDAGNLVFTGVTHDPETLGTLRAMGYAQPETVSEIVMGWHHGSRRATRTKRARELLTELMPTLLKRLAETASPDTAFLKFNDFLSNLPAGVQIFSLFNVNPQLLGLVADIMGSAPTLAGHLSKSPGLLDAVLYADFYGELPGYAALARQLAEAMPPAADFETAMDTLRSFRNEKQFQAGVHLLKRMIEGQRAGEFLSCLAELMLRKTLEIVEAEFARQYGVIAGAQYAIIALGRLGSREITFGSDIDLVFVYNADEDAQSDGKKPLPASQYFHRLTQRLLGALTAMGRDGRLYEVDIRLRPSGGQGLLMTSLRGLHQYFENDAWTFEYMAFTKARVVAGDERLAGELQAFIEAQIAKPREPSKLQHDVSDMRMRIAQQFGTENSWDIKYARGGLIDADFIAQYLLLLHAPTYPHARTGSAYEIMEWLARQGAVSEDFARRFTQAQRWLTELFHMLRLTSNGVLAEESAPAGLKKLLCHNFGTKDFDSLKAKLIAVEQSIRAQYDALLITPSNEDTP